MWEGEYPIILPTYGKACETTRKKSKENNRGDTSQVEFARRIGVSKSSLNRMEIGEQNVSLATLETLCARLKCKVGDLFKD